MRKLTSALRLTVGFLFVGAVVALIFAGLIVLLPAGRRARILWTNHMGSLLGWGVVRISGSRLEVTGREHAVPDRPVIYANNHTSTLDAFLTIWLTPPGTVGLAKKEIIYYPFYGQAWVLSGHPTVDRKSPERARASMKALGELVRKLRLSVCMLPEGTRARDGRLLPFKKGIVHLAIQTGLPIVPMVTTGAGKAWDKGDWTIRPWDIRVEFLEPIETTTWSLEDIDGHLADLRGVFVDALPDDMLTEEDRAARDARRAA